MKRLVSIGIPCFNSARWLAQAIESALAQSWPEKEVIVVDDGSTDESADIARKFGDRIQVIVTENRGGNHARNRALQAARGEWIQFLDADDYLEPEKNHPAIRRGWRRPGRRRPLQPHVDRGSRPANARAERHRPESRPL